MMFRIIPMQTQTAALNMALDQACLEAISEGRAPPTIRLYRWKPNAVSIGYFQCLTDEVDLSETKPADVQVVRRLTGGGAVYHDTEGEITYSILGPQELFPESIEESYKEICDCVIQALLAIGVKAEFRPVNDIIVEGKKISGNAQTRKKGVLLQHGTILYKVDAQKMFTYLTPDKSKVSDKPYIKSVKSAVTSISEHVSVAREMVEAALRKAFLAAYPASPGSWTEEEQERAKLLVAEQYGEESWNAMR